MPQVKSKSITPWVIQVSLALLLILPLMFVVSTGRLAGLIGRSGNTGRNSVQLATPARHAVQPSATSVPSAPALVITDGERGLIAYGDRLKVTFFETLDVPLDANGSTAPQRTISTVFPRMDLSGEYAVDENGAVNIPKLGQFISAGQAIPALQLSLAAAFNRAIGRTSDVHVAIVERQPVYVLGAVRSAGMFKHAPGMIVLQALAAAGGPAADATDTSKTIEGIRETERLRQAEQKFDRLLVRQARLEAQRENADRIRLPASIQSRLSAAGAHDELSAVVQEEGAALVVEQKNHQQQLSLAERQLRITQGELEAQTLRADQLRELRAKTESRFHELEQIASRGSVAQFAMTDAGVKLAELSAKQEDLRVAVAQAERRVVEAEAAKTRLVLDYAVGLEKDVTATRQEIDDCSHAIASMRAVTQVLSTDTAQAATNPNIRITRRAADGVTVIPATEDTPLLPGDVVQVSAGSRPSTLTSGIEQDRPRLQN